MVCSTCTRGLISRKTHSRVWELTRNSNVPRPLYRSSPARDSDALIKGCTLERGRREGAVCYKINILNKRSEGAHTSTIFWNLVQTDVSKREFWKEATASPSLHTTFSLPKMSDSPCPITNNLNLDMFPARACQSFLYEDLLRWTLP